MKRIISSLVAVAATLVAPGLANADTVTQWNQNAANALYVTAGQPPNVSVLHMAMVQGAVYDAVNAIDGGREGYLLTSKVATPTDSKDAAAATAAYKVLISIVPVQQPALLALYNATLAGIPDGASKTRGIAVGDAAAAAMRVPDRDDTGRMASRPAGFRQRPERLGQEREAVPDRGGVAVPLQRPVRAHEQEVRA